jgi:GcrA cell cycle regulator
MARPDFWTEERFDALKAMRAEGVKVDVMAARLETTRGSVIGKLHRAGLCEPARNLRKPKGSHRAPLVKTPATEPAPAPRAERAIDLLLDQATVAALSSPVADHVSDVRHATLTLVDLKPSSCRWVCNDPRDGALYCGAKAIPGKAWCREHHAIVYQPWHPRRVA